MHWRNRIGKLRTDGPLTVRRPDYHEQRQGNHLLVWRDIPYWVIVDQELHSLLTALDGRRCVDRLVASQPPSQRKTTVRALRHLHAAGIVSDGQDAAVPGGAIPPAGIANISINVTARCNLRCRYCYNLDSLSTEPPEELRAVEITDFLSSIRPLLTRDCSLTLLGGEPLLVPEKTLALARYGRRHGMQTIVSTNGHCVTDDFSEAARRSRLEVQVSLDGPNADLHDAIRGTGAFQRTLSGIRRLVDHRVFTIVSLVCHKENLDALEPFYSLAQELGVNEARFIPLKRLGGACKAGLLPADPKDLAVFAASMLRKRPDFRALLGRDALSILTATCARSVRQSSCGTGLRTFLLDTNGDLYPCLNTHVPALRLGNVTEAGFDFKRLWTESPLLRGLREDTSVEDRRNKCCDCVVKYWCLGYCRGEIFHLTGSLTDRAVDCGRHREAILETFWLLGAEPGLAQ